MVERGWHYEEMKRMKLSTLMILLEETVRRYNDLIEQQNKQYESLGGG
jgi:hypothetical protein